MRIRSRTHDGRPEGCSHRTTSALVCRTILTPPGRTQAGRNSDAWSDGYPDGQSDGRPAITRLPSRGRYL
jgi:hypothetical protein